MKLSVIAIICAIASAASVTAQGQQQGNKKPCEGRPEQECKQPECQPHHGKPRILNGRITWDFTDCFEPRKPSNVELPTSFYVSSLYSPEGQDQTAR
ncbi:hypothetical protein LRAMOSA11023 [Lichtheimia ramosa]|uniref:Uncharacterized protein n=1 Tax=Lichtheimia ramosa TaxID=688394 RepID=A0A077WV25_9FUNG|nr:hypothetical protein LRAMOSA11023 [Lichtheimia ramosa]